MNRGTCLDMCDFTNRCMRGCVRVCTVRMRGTYEPMSACDGVSLLQKKKRMSFFLLSFSFVFTLSQVFASA